MVMVVMVVVMLMVAVGGIGRGSKTARSAKCIVGSGQWWERPRGGGGLDLVFGWAGIHPGFMLWWIWHDMRQARILHFSHAGEGGGWSRSEAGTAPPTGADP